MQGKQTLIIIILVIIIFGGYFLFFRSDSSSDTSGSLLEVISPTGASVVENDILEMLRQLQTIELDGTIFASPAFTTLRDFSVELTDEPIGRSNPFVPVGTDAPLNPPVETEPLDDLDNLEGDLPADEGGSSDDEIE